MDHNCWCMKKSVIKTAWRSSNNASRRFLGCPDWCAAGHGGCNFFFWVVPSTCERSRKVIPGLIRRLENLDAEIKALKDELKECRIRARFAKGLLIATWVVIFYFMFISSKVEIAHK